MVRVLRVSVGRARAAVSHRLYPSGTLLQVLKAFGFNCGRATVKKTFRKAMIELHPDKVAQSGTATLQEAVTKEEMFKILMAKRDLLSGN